MSERKSRMITEDLQSLGKVKLSEVEECQRRILKILDDLRTAGQIRSESKKDIWV
jgi:flagellar motor switch protein FliG